MNLCGNMFSTGKVSLLSNDSAMTITECRDIPQDEELMI